jgi:hypothetical protein
VRLPLSTCPHLFRSHPNLSDEVNRNIVQSEIEGGVFLNDLPSATALEIQTQHHCYLVVLLSDNNAFISGHPQYCPEPILVANCRFDLGRFHAEKALRRPRYAPGVLSSRVPDTDCHVTYSGNPRGAGGAGPRSMRWRRSPRLTCPCLRPNIAVLRTELPSFGGQTVSHYGITRPIGQRRMGAVQGGNLRAVYLVISV